MPGFSVTGFRAAATESRRSKRASACIGTRFPRTSRPSASASRMPGKQPSGSFRTRCGRTGSIHGNARGRERGLECLRGGRSGGVQGRASGVSAGSVLLPSGRVHLGLCGIRRARRIDLFGSQRAGSSGIRFCSPINRGWSAGRSADYGENPGVATGCVNAGFGQGCASWIRSHIGAHGNRLCVMVNDWRGQHQGADVPLAGPQFVFEKLAVMLQSHNRP